jgi:hypothetical protein
MKRRQAEKLGASSLSQAITLSRELGLLER